MNQNGFSKLYWGFLFIMVDFKFQGFDILPDIVGYILFALGLSVLASSSEYFKKAINFNIAMIILSLLSIYEAPVQNGGFNFGMFGLMAILMGFVSFVLSVSIIYNIFMGIKDMAERSGQRELYDDADKRWNQYIKFIVAGFLVIIVAFIPIIGFLYVIGLFIASIMLTIAFMGLMQKCGERLT